MENLILETLIKNIKNPANVFVFPTQMAADLWADKATESCGVSAVAMERFVAWDDFKGKSIRSKHQDKTSIPAVLRSIFALHLIEENARNPFLRQLISPKFAHLADGFMPWISSLLPSLSLWKRNFDSAKANNSIAAADNEDLDLLEIYVRYKKFLDENNFFDPAWETPPFESDGNHYFIFFPEILSDYTEYNSILSSSDDITQINLPELRSKSNELKNSGELDFENLPECVFYSNSRVEIKNLSLYLRKVHEENGIDWQNMAVNVPDIESYGPYITRDFKIYQIPFVLRNARPLSSTTAGNLFSLIKECVSSDFSFDSVKNLLLNNSLPWNDEISIQQLIRFGQDNNCITNFDYNNSHFDVWEESFKQFPSETRAKSFFHYLKEYSKAICNAPSFSKIREEYFAFRSKFFDMAKCTPECDRILSRCISELGSLIDIEDSFPETMKGLKQGAYFSFYADYLGNVNYLEQASSLGVQILPYKTAACAPFDVHVVVDSSQKGISVVYKELPFLRDDKRRKILFGDEKADDPNVSQHFIRLYEMNSKFPCRFTCSSKTFAGYSQVSSYLKEIGEEKDSLTGDGDFIGKEKKWFSTNDSSSNDSSDCENQFPEKISLAVKKGFDSWSSSQAESKSKQNVDSASQFQDKSKILESYYSNGKIKVSATELKYFSQCPRSSLFNNSDSLHEMSNEASIMGPFAIGNLEHKIFELYFSTLSAEKELLKLDENGALPEEKAILLKQLVSEAIESEKQTDSLLKKDGRFTKNSLLASELIKSAKDSLEAVMKDAVSEIYRVFDGYQVYSAEKWYSLPERDSKNYEASDFVVNGKIDLVLFNPEENDFAIIDYKASSVPKKLFANDWKSNDSEFICDADFQMPLYIKLLENNNGKTPLSVDTACFFSIRDASFTPVIADCDLHKKFSSRTKYATRKDFDATIRYADEKIEDFTAKIKNADFSINEDELDYHQCTTCKYKAICRRTFNISRGE